jgi:hypothetical protein
LLLLFFVFCLSAFCALFPMFPVSLNYPLKYPVIPLMHCQYIVSIYNGINKCAGLFAKKLTASQKKYISVLFVSVYPCNTRISCGTLILLIFFVFCLSAFCALFPMFPVSLNYPLPIAPSGFSYV